ncbi:class I SAM-dependent methyltransferase [Thermoflexus sp.]|uniref:class I SAM-dependent methyltransferase n=1 Tax=Thermoflexus sp. TaxID=1969742 RepID=UPI0035E41412
MPAPFNRFFAFWQERAVRRLWRRCPPQPGERALDLGCGTGRWSRLLQQYGVRTVGVDLGFHALSWARRLTPLGSWAVMNLPRLGFQSGSFDWAISVTVLQHLPYSVQEETLTELRRLLRPGGRLVALELCQLEGEVFYLFPRQRRDWGALFQRHGFHVLGTQAVERLPWIPFLRRMASFGLREAPGGPRGIERAAAWFHQSRWPWIGLYLFLAVAYPLEGVAAFLGWSWGARYTAWLLRREG